MGLIPLLHGRTIRLAAALYLEDKMKWVLIIMVMAMNNNDGVAIDHIRFENQTLCEAAKSELLSLGRTREAYNRALCVRVKHD